MHVEMCPFIVECFFMKKHFETSGKRTLRSIECDFTRKLFKLSLSPPLFQPYPYLLLDRRDAYLRSWSHYTEVVATDNTK